MNWRGILKGLAIGVAIAAGLAGVRFMQEYQKHSQVGLTGKTRTAFVESSNESCIKSVQTEHPQVSPAERRAYCSCYSELVANEISTADLVQVAEAKTFDKLPPKFRLKMDSAGEICAKKTITP